MMKKMMQRVLPIIGMMVLASTGLWAQNEIGTHLFPPELVMEHQKQIGLTETQKEFLIKEIQTAQAEFTKWQWELKTATTDLNEMVASQEVDESQTMKQLEKILELERQIKQIQMRLMVRIKNQLTEQQQEQLQRLRQ